MEDIEPLHRQYGTDITNKEIVDKINGLVYAFNALNEETTINNYQRELDILKVKSLLEHINDVPPTDEEIKEIQEAQKVIIDGNRRRNSKI